MIEELNLNVREIELKDLDLIADYWLKSDPDFLEYMGVDLNKLPTRIGLIKMLTEQINTPIKEKRTFALVWELNGKQVGHTNVNEIEYGIQAKLHLHLWKADNRKKGIGTLFINISLPFYFEKLQLEKLICEPSATNPTPNNILEKIGFQLIKKYRTIPGSLNFEQEVNRWELTKENYLKF